jgi:hypothetical protein
MNRKRLTGVFVATEVLVTAATVLRWITATQGGVIFVVAGLLYFALFWFCRR